MLRPDLSAKSNLPCVRRFTGPVHSSLAFKEFSNNYGFVHTTFSPKYHQANGEAERAVQTIKSLLKKTQDPYKALQSNRTTPLEGIGLSPAQLLISQIENIFTIKCRPSKDTWSPRSQGTLSQKKAERESLLGVSNGPIQFESARKIWALLELLAKIR